MTVSTSQVRQSARDTAPPQMFTYQGTGVAGEPSFASTGVWRTSSLKITAPGQATQTWTFGARSHRWRLVSGGPLRAGGQHRGPESPVQDRLPEPQVRPHHDQRPGHRLRLRAHAFGDGPGRREHRHGRQGHLVQAGHSRCDQLHRRNSRPIGFQRGTTWVSWSRRARRSAPPGAGHDAVRAARRPRSTPWPPRGPRRSAPPPRELAGPPSGVAGDPPAGRDPAVVGAGPRRLHVHLAGHPDGGPAVRVERARQPQDPGTAGLRPVAALPARRGGRGGHAGGDGTRDTGQPGLEPDHLLRRPHRRLPGRHGHCSCSRAT